MKTASTLTKVVETVRTLHEGWEVCATAAAQYDRASSTLVVRLRCYVRPRNPAAGWDGFSPQWLPSPWFVSRRLPERQARSAVRVIFDKWCRRVGHAVRPVSRSRRAGRGGINTRNRKTQETT